MSARVGEVAPSFRLPSGQGPEVGTEDYRGRQNLVVWFTKGMACAFCRQHMSQIATAYPKIRELGGEVLQVTVTKPDRARFYAQNFRIPWPYLCDPDYRARGSWGMQVRSQSLGQYAKNMYYGMAMPAPPNDYGELKPSLREVPGLAADDDMGFFILDKAGAVRFALSGSYVGEQGARQIPTNEEIFRELERLAPETEADHADS